MGKILNKQILKSIESNFYKNERNRISKLILITAFENLL